MLPLLFRLRALTGAPGARWDPAHRGESGAVNRRSRRTSSGLSFQLSSSGCTFGVAAIGRGTVQNESESAECILQYVVTVPNFSGRGADGVLI